MKNSENGTELWKLIYELVEYFFFELVYSNLFRILGYCIFK